MTVTSISAHRRVCGEQIVFTSEKTERTTWILTKGFNHEHKAEVNSLDVAHDLLQLGYSIELYGKDGLKDRFNLPSVRILERPTQQPDVGF